MRKLVLLLAAASLCASLGLGDARANPNEARAAAKEKDRAQASPREIGGPLRFLDPDFIGTLPNDLITFGIDDTGVSYFELGDIATGEPFERMVHIAGGNAPYQIVVTAFVEVSGGNAQAVITDGIQLSDAGVVSGTYTGLEEEIFFDVRVVDSVGAELTGIFHLLVDTTLSFRFAQDRLAGAQLGLNYVTRIDTVNNLGDPVFFNVEAGSITLDGGDIDDLEEIGLTLNADGTLYGRPLQTGTLEFTCVADDGFGTLAVDYTDGLDEFQVFTVEIEDMTQAMSTVMLFTAQIKGNLEKTQVDSLAIKGILDLNGQLLANLAGRPITLRIGGGPQGTGAPYGRTYTAIVNGTGKAKSDALGEDDDLNEIVIDQFSFSVNTKGFFSAKVKATDLLAAVNAENFADGDDVRIYIEIAVGRLLAVEALEMPAHVTATRYEMRYALNRDAQKGQPLAGGGQGFAVAATDVGAGGLNPGDKFTLRFYGAPRFGIDGSDLAGTGSATLRLGDGFEQSMSLDTSTPRPIFKREKGSDEPVIEFRLDPKGMRHFATTQKILEDDTLFPLASESSEPYGLQVELDAGSLSCATTVLMFPNRSKWQNKP
ncbi:MAG: hypothetical protein L6R28_20505 [Planctomycetes bacterium]|nr:hypothetical protein [Planctomycetota bacterium]